MYRARRVESAVRGFDAAGPQDRSHGVTQVPFLDGGRGIDRKESHDVQEMALNHVAKGAGSVVVAGPALQCQVLVKDDLHLLNVVPVPYRLQEPVGETQPQDVQYRGFAQEMVHSVDVVLGDQCGEGLVELMRRFLARSRTVFPSPSRVPGGS